MVSGISRSICVTRGLPAAIALALVLGPVSVVSPATAAPPGAPEATDAEQDTPSFPTQVVDETTAMALAARYDTPIEVLSELTESSQTFAQPDGTLRVRQSAAPQRLRRGDRWV